MEGKSPTNSEGYCDIKVLVVGLDKGTTDL
jgi:hypothetical protein